MKKIHLYVFGAVITTAILFSCNQQSEKKSEADTLLTSAAMTPEQMVERGKYLAATSGCNDCHTPKIMTDAGPAPDMSRMLSGHPAGNTLPPYDKAMIGPWVMFSSDLTAAVGPWQVIFFQSF